MAKRTSSLPIEPDHPAQPRQIVISFGMMLVLFVAANLVLAKLANRSGFDVDNRKWHIIKQQTKPIDWMVVGDSHGLNGIVPSIMEATLGGECLNLCGHAGMHKLSDSWKISYHVQHGGPPKHAVVITAYHSWPHGFDEYTGQLMARIPLPSGYWNQLQPVVHPTFDQYRSFTLGRYVPLYSSNLTLAEILMHPGFLRRQVRAAKAVAPVAAPTEPTAVDPRDLARGYVPAEALAPEVQAKQLAAVREEIPKVPFSISPMNQMALDAMAAMAAEHKFTIYLVNGPLNETIVTPATKPYFDALDRALTDFAEAHPHVEHIPGYATYPSSETRDEGHLLATAARKYTAWVAESIQRP